MSEINLLLIDNYDSFTYNLQHYLLMAGAKVQVLFNDDPKLKEEACKFGGLVISPGPSRPEKAGYSMEIFRECASQLPILGVCLGMQIINQALGGKTIRAEQPVHGKAFSVHQIATSPLFDGLPRSFKAARYHSLICDRIPEELEVTAVYKNIPMAFQHSQLPVYGVQFHPESFLTSDGLKIIKNFVSIVHETLA
ncbi:MAG: aminodeoxychorismate/anthranilate synthase component II [Caldisericaceae bacterium]|nr:aminodeoxychorismate/anthranilate synthase component II [Caldisericaceae bacterium]